MQDESDDVYWSYALKVCGDRASGTQGYGGPWYVCQLASSLDEGDVLTDGREAR